MFFEFKAKNQSGWMVLEAFSVSHGKASTYPSSVCCTIAILDRALGVSVLHFLALFGIVEGNDSLAQMDANIRKRRTLDALKQMLLRESLNQPLMVMFEDLHCAPASSRGARGIALAASPL